jgi:hypothetical protein
MIHPNVARTLVEQRYEQLVQDMRYQNDSKPPGSRVRRLPRWRISWSRTVLSPAGVPGTAGGGRQDHQGKGGSSLVIIISAYRSA